MQAVIAGVAEGSQDSEVTRVMSKLLPDFPRKEVVMITVTYSPGRSGAVHRHNADGFIYVLEGSIVMGVNGGEPITLAPYYVGPEHCAEAHNLNQVKNEQVIPCGRCRNDKPDPK